MSLLSSPHHFTLSCGYDYYKITSNPGLRFCNGLNVVVYHFIRNLIRSFEREFFTPPLVLESGNWDQDMLLVGSWGGWTNLEMKLVPD